jgi:hypothetical protein
MDDKKCSCEKFDRLTGASVPAYTASFLERISNSQDQQGIIFRCRICGRRWERRSPTGDAQDTRDSLIKLRSDAEDSINSGRST